MANIPVDRVHANIPANRTFEKLEELIADTLLDELSDTWIKPEGVKLELATEITKDGPVKLAKSARSCRTVKELLEHGFTAPKNVVQLYLTFEEFQDDAYEEDLLETSVKLKAKTKEESKDNKTKVKAHDFNRIKAKKEKGAQKEKDTKQKEDMKEELVLRKRGISQLSLTEDESYSSPYALRSRE